MSSVPLSKHTSAFWEPVFHAIDNTFDLENTLVRGGVDNTLVRGGVENTFYLCNG